jgi:hypothetical protein
MCSTDTDIAPSTSAQPMRMPTDSTANDGVIAALTSHGQGIVIMVHYA